MNNVRIQQQWLKNQPTLDYQAIVTQAFQFMHADYERQKATLNDFPKELIQKLDETIVSLTRQSHYETLKQALSEKAKEIIRKLTLPPCILLL